MTENEAVFDGGGTYESRLTNCIVYQNTAGRVGANYDASEFDAAELPEKTSRYMKAMTSGGSTGRPKLIVAEQTASIDPEQPFLVMGSSGS